MKRRNLIQMGAAATAGLTLAGVPLHLLAAGKKGGVINAVVQPEPPGLMLGITQNGPTQMISGNIYEGLLRYDEKINPLPSLATSWTVNKEGTLYTFKLKPGVTWHDGKPFTSADVVFSADVFLRKTHARLRANLAAVESIRAVDPLTVEFRMKTRAPLVTLMPPEMLAFSMCFQRGELKTFSICASVMSDLRSPRFQLLHISQRASQTKVQWKMTTVGRMGFVRAT